ncbi:MAG: hypothetical protein IPN95_25995 [Bacteroidetes bacterium]|nr:hypothetical protein [Bacteroidota bacterium]
MKRLEVPFKANYIDRLFVMSSRHENDKVKLREIPEKVAARFSFNEDRRNDIARLEAALGSGKE